MRVYDREWRGWEQPLLFPNELLLFLIDFGGCRQEVGRDAS